MWGKEQTRNWIWVLAHRGKSLLSGTFKSLFTTDTIEQQRNLTLNQKDLVHILKIVILVLGTIDEAHGIFVLMCVF